MTLTLALALLLSSTAFAAPSSVAVDEGTLLSAAQPVLAEYEKHYDIDNMGITVISETEKEDGGAYIEYYVEFDGKLKYSSATELPQIRGLASAFNIESQTLTTQEFGNKLRSAETIATVTETVSAKAATLLASMSADELTLLSEISAVTTAGIGISNPYISSKTMVARAIAEIVTAETIDFVENIENLYIGETSSQNVGLYVEFDRFGNLVDTQYIVFNGYTDDITAVIPASMQEMMELGIQQADDYITAAVETISRISAISGFAANTDPTYYKLSARDYANTYTSNAELRVCDNENCNNGKNGGSIRMNVDYYNTESYSWYCCNDCANFVSQAMYEGGIPTDSTWKPDSYAWKNCGGMLDYFWTAKGWWTESSLASAAAGDVIVMSNSRGAQHVAMVVLNDTVTRRFSAHTNDRKELKYTSTSSFGSGYTSIKFYKFSNFVVEYKP